jgi:hypothetical protein
MSEIVYQICLLLEQVLFSVPLGTNLGLFWLFVALLSGRFLCSRGAVFPALLDLGLSKEAVRRSEAALCYGCFSIADLLGSWHKSVLNQGRWQPHSYEGIRPVPCDLVGFFRPHLAGCAGKHYQSVAGKALPAVVFALVAAVGSVGKMRHAVPRLILRQEPTEKSEACLQKRALRSAAEKLAAEEALVTDAGFGVADLLECEVARFVARVDKNFTARRNAVPAQKPRGRRAEYGELVRPLARRRAGKTIAATEPDKKTSWKEGKWTVRAHLFNNLTLPSEKPGAASFQCVAILDPRYKDPLLLVNYNLSVSARSVRCLYRDRWPIEKLPQAAKQMLGAERAFVFGKQSRYRLPELALLAGNILSYVAALAAPVASGFWDRAARPTCGRLRRLLARQDFSKLPLAQGQLRKKESVTDHLPKGVIGHRRTKTVEQATLYANIVAFTGN